MKSEKGQALVEFALVLPVILLLLFSMIDFGRVLYAKSELTGICQEDARHASIYWKITNTSDPDYVQNYIDSNKGTLTGTFHKGQINGVNYGTAVYTPSKSSGSVVTVNLRYDVDLITPLLEYIPGISDPIIITSSASFRVE